jgi:chemotaxis response regulator CheB
MILSAQPDLEVVAEANNGLEAVEQAAATRPDVVIMDVNMET